MTAMDSGLSRFAQELPAVDRFVGLGEGNTPVLPLDALAEQLGVASLAGKMESLNPTGSYKDRAAAMSLSLAVSQGYRGWIATSSGNAGVAFAAYGTRARLPGFLCMVSTAPLEKRVPLMPYNIGLAAVEGIGRDSTSSAGPGLMEQVRAAASRYNLFLGITANTFNPGGMRGIDTIGYELAEQCAGATHVYVPTGGGGLLVSLARGLARRGMASKVIACQPAGCAPIAGYVNGELDELMVHTCDTDISALQLPNPPDGAQAVDAVTASGGWGVAVADADILAAQRLLAATEGVFVEPASATALAALMMDVERGQVGPGDHPVLVLTGAGWKDLGRFGAEAERTPVVQVGEVDERIDKWAADALVRS